MAWHDEVLRLRWPADAGRRPELEEAGVPRLWLVDASAGPPDVTDCLEDWVRLPVAEADLRCRAETLARRADRPAIDPDGLLRWRAGVVPLPPLEHRLTEALLARFGSVCSREALTAAGWPGGAPGRNALDVHVLRLRRRIAPLGLAIRTVRARGYLLVAVRTDEPVANLA